MNRIFCNYIFTGILTCAFFVQGDTGNLFSQSGINLKAEGDRLFEAGDYELAEEVYRTVPEKERSPELLYNLGNALFKQQRYEEAGHYYEMAESQLAPPHQLADAVYNKGNSHFEQGEFRAAVDAYRKALLNNPDHTEARNNLLLSQMMMDAMPPQPQGGEDQEDGDQPPDPAEEGEMDEGSDSDENGDDSDESLAEMEDETQMQSGTSTEESPPNLDEQRLEQLLQIAEQDDQQSRRKMNERQSDRGQTLKDW